MIHGVRQVRRTWQMKEFRNIVYDQDVYVNFDINDTQEHEYVLLTNERGSAEIDFVVNIVDSIYQFKLKL